MLSGLNCTVTDIEVRHIRGTATQHGVWVGYDGGQANTDNGSYGHVKVLDVDVSIPNNASGAAVFANFRTGIDNLHVQDVVTPAGIANYAVWVGLGTTAVVKKPTLNNLRMRKGASGRRLVRILAGIIENLRMDNAVAREVPSAIAVELSSATTITTALVSNPQLSSTDTTTTDWIKQATGCPIGTLTIVGGRIGGGRGLAELRATATVVLDGGLRVEPGTNGLNRLSNIYWR